MNEPPAISTPALDFELIVQARDRIAGHVKRTPVLTNSALDAAAGAELFFKCENLQDTGSFKLRGATNAVLSLSRDAIRNGVATHSSGNHAAALAHAAALRGIPAYIVMPRSTPMAKRDNVTHRGGKLSFCEASIESRESAAALLVSRTGATLVHPYDDFLVMAGQGTAAFELLEELPQLDVLLCPVSGGGLLSGTAVAAKSLQPGIRVTGVEPVGADDAYRSFRCGRVLPMPDPRTVADALRGSLCARTFAEIHRHVDDVVRVSDTAIVRAMRRLWDHLKTVVEPSGAVAYAAVMDGAVDVSGKRVGLILSGGNLDLDELPWT